MDTWLLCDYGQVLSTPPPADEWERLRRVAGDLPAAEFHSIYWEHRPAYDRADLDATGYWDLVLGEEPTGDLLAEIVRLDRSVWLHPNRASVEAALRAGGRGRRLAIFSNAPVEVAAAIDTLEWLQPFEARFYSCHLRAVKPEPAAYRQVLDGLGTPAENVLFVDDRPDNVEAARREGIQAEVFTGPEVFDRVG